MREYIQKLDGQSFHVIITVCDTPDLIRFGWLRHQPKLRMYTAVSILIPEVHYNEHTPTSLLHGAYDVNPFYNDLNELITGDSEYSAYTQALPSIDSFCKRIQ